MNTQHIRALLLDYGGTIDINGRHWARLLWQAYQACGIPTCEEDFRAAYVDVEKLLGRANLIQPHFDFSKTLRVKIGLQLELLFPPQHIHRSWTQAIEDYCMAQVEAALLHTRPVVETLGKRFRLAVVSNFYGNLNSVMRHFGLGQGIDLVIESARVGIRKPDAAIFSLALEQLGIEPHQAVVVGDSMKNDIRPALSLGCQAVWLCGDGWERESHEHTPEPTAIISSLTQLPALLCAGGTRFK